ncbi:hypothetical protein ATO12_03970 [Aquimarina atlantica]|uniref:Bacteriocin n=1 Tax=Aquimarina atlantica TaxID=1317122 RepID=A0A023C0W2_9FLAO|nr:hypothetical protein [Aquimarina atlantica]EZH75957.1 hypothetical protein ATO12_03970 [Aquimarina atlantica]
MRDLKFAEVKEVSGGPVTASEAAGASCAVAIIGGAALIAGTGGLGAVAAWSLGLAACTGFTGAAVTSKKDPS